MLFEITRFYINFENFRRISISVKICDKIDFSQNVEEIRF